MDFEGDNSTTNRLMDNVFSNDFLRDMILGHFISSTPATNHADICSARLVQKAWLNDVNRLLFKTERSLFYLQLNPQNSLNDGSYVQNNRVKILDHFVSTMEHSMDNVVSAPFSLKIEKEFFQKENDQSFLKLLTSKCIQGLRTLDLFVPLRKTSMTLILPESAYFPRLQSLSVSFCRNDTENESNSAAVEVNNHPPGFNSYFVPFLHFILSRPHACREFLLNDLKSGHVPSEFKYSTLPKNLRILFLNTILNTSHLEELAANSFSRLTSLFLRTSADPLPSHLLYQILDKVRYTLRDVQLRKTGRHGGPPRNLEYIRFPVMDSLKICELDGICIQREKFTKPLHTYLPKVETLELSNQTYLSWYHHWINNSCFENVAKVVIRGHGATPSYITVLEKNEMRAIHKAFPNLQQLSVEDSKVDIDDKKHFIFTHMARV